MTPASAIGQIHLRLATPSPSARRQRGGERRVAAGVLARRARTSPAATSAQADGLYGVARAWPAWIRLLVIGGLGVASWAALILAALPLIR